MRASLELDVHLAHARLNGGGSSLARCDGVQVEQGGCPVWHDYRWSGDDVWFTRGFSLSRAVRGHFCPNPGWSAVGPSRGELAASRANQKELSRCQYQGERRQIGERGRREKRKKKEKKKEKEKERKGKEKKKGREREKEKKNLSSSFGFAKPEFILFLNYSDLNFVFA